jgi:uncharacterized membrane protein
MLQAQQSYASGANSILQQLTNWPLSVSRSEYAVLYGTLVFVVMACSSLVLDIPVWPASVLSGLTAGVVPYIVIAE